MTDEDGHAHGEISGQNGGQIGQLEYAVVLVRRLFINVPRPGEVVRQLVQMDPGGHGLSHGGPEDAP